MPNEKVIAYKGFTLDMKCREFQFAVGETYQHDGKVESCANGFHSCEHPLDVFGYYPPSESRFAIVEASGEISREKNGDTKIASGRITIKAELTMPDMIAAAVKYVFDRAKSTKKGTNDEDNGAASATGESGAASATGDRGAASATGDRGAASATGWSGAASATGESGAASATGDRGAASATGWSGAASATGESGAASATGDRGAASATGGKHCVAMATGEDGRARGSVGCAIVLVNRANDGSIRHIRCAKVGEGGLKPDVWYSLNTDGEFIEV